MAFLLILVLATVATAGHARIHTGAVRWRHRAVRWDRPRRRRREPSGRHPHPSSSTSPAGCLRRRRSSWCQASSRSSLGALWSPPDALRPSSEPPRAAFLVSVFPANVYVTVAGVDVDGLPGGLYPSLRLPLQAVFVVWAWASTRPIRDPAEIEPFRPFGLMRPSHQSAVRITTTPAQRRPCRHRCCACAGSETCPRSWQPPYGSRPLRRFPRRDQDVTPRCAAASHVLDAVTLALRRRPPRLRRPSRPPRADAPLPTRHAIIEVHHVAGHRRSSTHLERRGQTNHDRCPADRRSPGGSATRTFTSRSTPRSTLRTPVDRLGSAE